METELLRFGGGIAVIVALGWLAKVTNLKFGKNGNGSPTGYLEAAIKQGVEIGTKLIDNSMRQTVALEHMVKMQEATSEKLDRVFDHLKDAVRDATSDRVMMREDILEIKKKVANFD